MTWAFILTGVVVLITHALEAVTGFGCTVLALPFATWLLGIDRAKILLMVLAWILALYFAVIKYQKINFRQFGVIILFAGLGLPLGIAAFDYLPKQVLIRSLGVFIVVSASIQLYKLIFPAKEGKGLPPAVYYALLFAGGIIHGAFASGGPLVVLYASKVLKDKGEFRATLCLLWASLNTILIAQALYAGNIKLGHYQDLGYMLPVLGAGIVIGEIIHNRVNAELFKRAVFSILLVVGIIMAIRP